MRQCALREARLATPLLAWATKTAAPARGEFPRYAPQIAKPRPTPGGSDAAIPLTTTNTCSIQSYEPSAELVAYAPTKAVLVNLTKVLAKAAGRQGIRVNGVAPSPVWTPLIPSTMPQEKVKSFGKNTVFERAAQPAELAPLYVFLASQDATYVTARFMGLRAGEHRIEREQGCKELKRSKASVVRQAGYQLSFFLRPSPHVLLFAP
jgi:NAD(P)-dependent dehydrogenase (short-subunit alcohol dehydrogenase family)